MTFAFDPTSTSQTEGDDTYEKTAPELDLDELLIRIKNWWRQDQPHCALWHTEAKQDFAFRAGDQWPEEDAPEMNAARRARLTFNQIDPVIDAVAGSEITNRQEVRYIPRQVSDGPVNEVLTEAARWFRDQCDADHEESAAFTDAATCGMGWTETRLDYEENPNGDPKITRVDPLEMFWDHAAKQANLIDARRIFQVQRKVPLRDAQERWPNGPDGVAIEDDSIYDAAWASNESEEETPYAVHTAGDPLEHSGSEGREERTVTLMQVQWFERESYYRSLMIDPDTGAPKLAEFSEEQHEMATQRSLELGVPYRAVKQMRKVYYRAFIGAEVLEMGPITAPSGKPATAFNFVPITGKWDRNKQHFYGLVRSMRGPQEFANKWLSTTVEIMARQAKGGLMLEEGTVADTEEFEQNWSTPGANAYFKPGAITGGRVTPKPASQFPNDFMQMTAFAIAAIRQVTGVNAEQLGMAQQQQPASLEYQRRQSATVILAPLFDSLSRYRRIQGRLLLFLITEYLSDGRLIRIVGDQGEQYVPLMHDPNVTEYDVIVDDAPSSPSQKELVWNSLVQVMPLVQNLNPPPQAILALLDYSPIPSSVVSKIKQAVAEAAQAAQQAPPQLSPMDLIMQEKQAGIQENQQKNQQNLQFKQQDQMLDLQHQQALAELELQGKTAEAEMRIQMKQRELHLQQQMKMLDQAQPPEAVPNPMHDGMQAGIKAGAQRFATELTAGHLAQQAGLPEGTPTHIGTVPGGPSPLQQAAAPPKPPTTVQ